nr:unnamed protein product [Callosobruchus analis]
MADKELEDARNCVKEANLFEENMTAEEIRQTYHMIQLSEKSGEEDEQKRADSFIFETESDNSETVEQNIHSLVEELCSPSTIILQEKEVTQPSEQNNKGSNKLNGLHLLDATKVKFGYLDMLPMSPLDYKLIDHKSNFVAIQHTEEFCNADYATKAKMMSAHWSKISKAKAEARKAKLSSNQTRHRSEFRCILIASRHTKRKCYATSDDDDSNDVIKSSPKKSKTIDRASNNSNHNNSSLNSESKVKSLIKKSKSNPAEDIEQENRIENDITVTSRSKPKKLSNEEIMKRSSLFGTPSVKKKRSEEMLNKLIEEQAKKKKEERLMEKFEKSIDSTIEDDEPEPAISIDEVKVVYPRRVIPPVPRKNIGSRSNKIAAALAMSNQASNSTTSQDPEVSSSSRSTVRNRPASTKQSDKIEAALSISDVGTSDFSECPICQKPFHVEAIERLKRMQCEICGGHFPFGDRYNIHVTDCLQARQEQDEESQQLISKYRKLNK